MEDIKFKYIEDIYVVAKDDDYNIFVAAVTEDGRKLSSSMYATKEDIEILHGNVLQMDAIFPPVRCELSTGKMSLSSTKVLTADKGEVFSYNISLCDGKFKSNMSGATFAQFKVSIRFCYNEIKDSTDISKKKNPYRYKESIISKFRAARFKRKITKANRSKKGLFE
jgi:hypothetical protein